MKTADVPKFGNLSGVRVAFQAANIAAPFAAELMAEHGATVIQLENTNVVDMARTYGIPYCFLSERKNILSMNCNVRIPEGREMLLRLVETLDIYIEGNKGGSYEKWGLTDELLWEHNPKLVIVHSSGFGQTGIPEYVSRGAYDPIGQAYGGAFYNNGTPEKPLRMGSLVGDYMNALFVCWSSLAALHKASTTGKGESIDVAMFEALWKCQSTTPMHYMNDGIVDGRQGNRSMQNVCMDVFECRDGESVYLAVSGVTLVKKAIEFIGLSSDPRFENKSVLQRADPDAQYLEDRYREFCMEHTGEEAEKMLLEAGLPCSRIYNMATMVKDPHAKARELFVTWEDENYGTVGGVNVVPKMKKDPGVIWRGAPLYAQDNEDILRELGYGDEDIKKLYEAGAIRGPIDNGGYRMPPKNK